MKLIIVIILLWCGLSVSIAQEKCFSLDSCISYALMHRTEIIISENSGKDIRKNIGYLQQQQLPNLNASLSHDMNWGRSLNTEKYEWEESQKQYGNMSLSSSLTLFGGLKLRNQIRAGKLNIARDMTIHQKLKDDIRLEVIQSFYEVLAAGTQCQLTEVFYQSDVRQEERVYILDSVKRVATPDKLEITGQTRKSLIAKRNAEKQYQLALLKFKRSMNYRGEEEIKLVCKDTLIKFIVPEAEQVYEMALKSLPAIKIQHLDSLLLINQFKQLKGNFSPILSLGGVLYSRYQNDLNDPESQKPYTIWGQLKDNNYKQVGLSLTIPIFNKNTTRRQIKMLKTDMFNQHLNTYKLLNDIRYEIEQICLEADMRSENYHELEEQEKNYQKIFHLREIQFSRGKLSVYDLLTAESNWRNMQINLLLERFNLLCYLDMIKVYIGN